MGMSSHGASVKAGVRAGARALVDARLAELGDALDGYPARTLLDDCTRALDDDGTDVRCNCALVDHVLTQWADQLRRDIDQLPPETIQIVGTIRQRMVDTREALLRLHALVRELGELQAGQHTRNSSLRHALTPVPVH